MSQLKKSQYTIDECYLMMFSEYEDVVTAQEAADMLRLPVKRVYRMFRSGELKSLRIGGDIRTCKLWIIEYIQEYGFIRQEKFHHERRAAVTVFCQTPKSRKQIQEFLDLADKRFFRESVLYPLLEDGTLVMTDPDNPTDVHQRYVAARKVKTGETIED
jgi:excisionase family DNA binding protein